MYVLIIDHCNAYLCVYVYVCMYVCVWIGCFSCAQHCDNDGSLRTKQAMVERVALGVYLSTNICYLLLSTSTKMNLCSWYSYRCATIGLMCYVMYMILTKR
jgi:hypothetical protein